MALWRMSTSPPFLQPWHFDASACIQAGAEEVIVLPYFLSAGRHVIEDIPREVAGKQQEYPEVPIRLAPYLGSAAGITELLLGVAE